MGWCAHQPQAPTRDSSILRLDWFSPSENSFHRLCSSFHALDSNWRQFKHQPRKVCFYINYKTAFECIFSFYHLRSLWKALHKKHLSKLGLKKLSEDSMHLPSWEQEMWSWPCFPFYDGCQETPSESWNQPLLTIVNYWGIYFLPVCLDFILFLNL